MSSSKSCFATKKYLRLSIKLKFTIILAIVKIVLKNRQWDLDYNFTNALDHHFKVAVYLYIL